MTKTDVVLISVENGYVPSLSMLSLESYLSKEGIKTEILHPMIKKITLKFLVNEVVALKPIVVGIGGLFNDRFIVKKIIEALTPYRKNFKIVIGGNLVTPIPEFMLEKLCADVGVIGEGEIIFLKLVKRIMGNKDYSDIKGIVLKKKGAIIANEPGEYVKNLNEIPTLNYNKIPMEHFVQAYKFYKNITRNTIYTPSSRLGFAFTGRGCLYKCNFCYHYNPLCLLRISDIIAQIKEMKESFNVNMIMFIDDLAFVNKERSRELCEALKKENIKYLANAHLGYLDEEMVKALKESGCIQLGLGLESGSQKILDGINKHLKIEQIKEGLSLLQKYEIKWNGGVQIGQLNETKKDIEKTINLFYPYIDELSTVSIHFTTPYPGTPLYLYGLKTGLIDNEMFYNNFSGLQKLTVNFSKVSNWWLKCLRLKLAFKFDLRKQQKIKGKLIGFLFLVKALIVKYANDICSKVTNFFAQRKETPHSI